VVSPPVRRPRGGNQRRDPARRPCPVEQWPSVDRLAWTAALKQGDRLRPGGPASQWAPRTRAIRAQGYGRWLAWLDRRGWLAPLVSPAERVTPEHVAAYIDDLLALGNTASTALCRIDELYNALRVIAPDADRRWLLDFTAQLRDESIPSPRKRAQLKHADELFNLGKTLMREAEADQHRPVLKRSVQYRDGLMIALLATRPMRIGNFAGLRIDQHLIAEHAGYRLELPAAETKNRRRLDYDVPVALVADLTRYLTRYRRLLLTCGDRYPAAASDALWISREGAAMFEGSIRDSIKERTLAAFGVAIPPHRFRDAAATDFVEKDPAHALAAASVLGNDPVTMMKHYNQSRGRAAHLRHHAGIVELRRKKHPDCLS
jgi:integrase/recombinase XerD